jgi:SOS-response transcriptional repressor LexA
VPADPTADLTKPQELALAVYRRLTEKLGAPPSVRQFAAALGKSHNAAHAMIGKLREKGYLSMKPITLVRPTLTAKARRAQ